MCGSHAGRWYNRPVRIEPDRGKVCEDACIVVDVFAGRVLTAPHGYRRRWRDIGAACEEIRRLWPTV